MSVEIIKEKLKQYNCKTHEDEINALKEILQEIMLLVLSRSGFFRNAAFQGGTCLRILFGLNRFSEDLDFVLLEQDKNFDWVKYILSAHDDFLAYGFDIDFINKTKVDKAIKTAFLKTDSQGGLLVFSNTKINRTIKIKLEIDTNPPEGSNYEIKFLDFPLPYSIQIQDMPSLFASKCHALLCREYLKGRDWFDFSWYISQNTSINFILLKNAINQAGPWKDKNINTDKFWLINELKNKINIINWNEAKNDVQRFLRPKDLPILDLWSREFFLDRLEKLNNIL